MMNKSKSIVFFSLFSTNLSIFYINYWQKRQISKEIVKILVKCVDI